MKNTEIYVNYLICMTILKDSLSMWEVHQSIGSPAFEYFSFMYISLKAYLLQMNEHGEHFRCDRINMISVYSIN